MNENEFFREATLKICGNLAIEDSMHSTLQYLQQVMPVGWMAIEHFDGDAHGMRTIATADSHGGKSVDLLTPLSEHAGREAEFKYDADTQKVYLFKDPSQEELAREMLDFHGIQATSLLVLILGAEKQRLGTLAIASMGEKTFTQKDADLLALLSEPFAIALSNTLKHRNELKLFNREFFFEMTKRICGTLEIEQGLYQCLKYISNYMPAEQIYLQRYESDLNAMRLIARADHQSYEGMDQLVPVDGAAKEKLIELMKVWPTWNLPTVLVANRSEEDPVTRCMLQSLNIPASSAMNLPLIIQDQAFGRLVLLAEGNDRYNEQHARLFALLKDPFSIAMSNTLKHRNELRLFNRDFFWEVTRRICGNLEIEEGLHTCVKYISQFMPADRIYLQRYEANLNSMHLIARADKEHYEKMDQLILFSDAARNKLIELSNTWRKGKLPPILVINKPAEEPVTLCMLKALNEPMSSALSLPLLVENRIIGTLVLLAKGNNRYDEEHAKLFTTLKLPFFVALSNTLKHRELLKLKELLADDNRYLQKELRRISGDTIVGVNYGLKNVMFHVQQVAQLDSPVLLLGETGVGKDVIANAIHYSSSRKDGPFVSVNCGAIPDSLIDSELFGHEKGAFTGALFQKRGRFERANNGTIFLDEIGELPLEAQVRLLKVLQDKEIERVGGTKTIHLNIRIIAATNRNLEEMIAAKEFREDLWFRLNVFPIHIPPLRDRKSDIPDFIQFFITQKAKELNLPGIPTLAPGAIDVLMNYPWPGNVRELENLVERALILAPSGPLSFDNLRINDHKKIPLNQDEGDEALTLDEMTSRYIQKILRKTSGKIHGKGGAADLLGINPNTLRNRMNKLGIQYGRKS